MSISRPDQYPSWDEIMEAMRKTMPTDLFYIMPIPPENLWINEMPNCFHVHESRDEDLNEQMRFEGEIRGRARSTEGGRIWMPK